MVLGGGLQRGLQTGLGRGLAVKLRSGLVQYMLKFNSFELDSEVGRLVICSTHVIDFLESSFNMNKTF